MKKYILVLIVLISIFSCQDSTMGGPARIEVYLEDAPGMYDNVTVSLEEFAVYDGSEWKTMKLQRRNVIITDLTGGRSALVATQEVPAGNYSKLRMTFASQGHAMSDGTNPRPLAISESDRTLELAINVNSVEGPSYVMCDMDVHRSVDTARMLLKPRVSIVDLNTWSALSGTICDSASNKIAEMMLVKCRRKSDEFTKHTYTNRSTAKMFIRLPEGEYEVSILPSDSSKYTSVIETMNIESHTVKELGLIKLEKKKK